MKSGCPPAMRAAKRISLNISAARAATPERPDRREKPENREELYGIYYNLLNEGFRFADSQYNQGHAFKFTKENDRIYEEWAERAAKFLFIMEEEGGLPPKKKDLKTAEAHGEDKGER